MHKGKFRTAVVTFLRDPKSNVCIARGVTRTRVAATLTHLCSTCNKAHETKQQLTVHAYREHGIAPLIRQKMSGEICEACLEQFCNRPLMRNHAANRSPLCTVWYAAHGKPYPDEVIQDEIVGDRELVRENKVAMLPRYHSTFPPGQMPGPRPEFAVGRHEFAPKNR